MATYYVRSDGNDANTGTGSASNQAWQTIGKAIGSTGISSGDTLYIAPGIYRGNFTVSATAFTSATYIIGDVTASQFIGVTAGSVRLTSRTVDTGTTSGTTFTATSKPFLNISSIYFDGRVALTSCSNLVLEKSLFWGSSETSGVIQLSCASGATTRNVFRRNIVICGNSNVSTNHFGLNLEDAVASQGTLIQDCLFHSGVYTIFVNPGISNIDARVINCTFTGYTASSHVRSNFTNAVTITNSLFVNGSGSTSVLSSNSAGCVIENYNRILMAGTLRSNVATGVNSTSTGWDGIEYGQSLLMGYDFLQMYTSLASSPNIDFGTSTNALATDIYGVTWTGTTPTAGSGAYRSLNDIGLYLPTERNASAITIAPASTSQSIELYLGATGLTASTSGLTARYNRTRTESVSISLVARTIAQAWTSGGFAEVDATNMPGVYRLDVPDAAFAAGASDVTIVVRGASGTNGAVLTVTLSSGGLTAAQTAAAVWDEARASHTTAGTFGQYVNAELVTPVTSAALVRMGPFEVRADGLGASDPLDIQKGAQHGIDIQCVDNNGAGIDITSATVTAKVYNSGATLVDTYSCTATYAADGRATFTIDTTVTNTPGTYTATITRTTGASDTQVFGPLRIYVRDI
jgi:hypothetical protein